MSVHEALYGLRGKSAEGQIERAQAAFSRNLIVLPTMEDFERSAVIRAEARRRGQALALGDRLIGATAERRGLAVVTGNTAHFQAMAEAGLAVELENRRLG